MKIKNLSIVALGALVVVFSACSVTKRHYAPGYHVEWHKNYKGTEQVAQVKKEKATVNVVEEMVAMNEVAAPVVVAEVAAPAVVAPVMVEEVAVVAPTQNRVINAIAKKVANVASKVSAPTASEVSIEASAANGFMPEWYHWVLCILPWFPAFMFWRAVIQKNDIPWKKAIIGVLLYMLCYVPGLIYCIKWMKSEF